MDDEGGFDRFDRLREEMTFLDGHRILRSQLQKVDARHRAREAECERASPWREIRKCFCSLARC